MTTTTNQSKRPTHVIWQVIGDDDNARWIRVGAAWEHRDGQGMYLRFDAYPVVGKTVIREIAEKTEAADSQS